MRRDLIFISLILIIVASCKKNTRILHYYDGSIKAEISINSRGVPNGEFKVFYKNGSLRSEGCWINGVGNGYRKMYYENGNLREFSNWRNRQLHGDVKLFFPSGATQLEAMYDDGKKINSYKIFNQNGRISEHHLYGLNESLYYVVKYSKDDGSKELELLFPLINVDTTSTIAISGKFPLSFSGQGIISFGHMNNQEFISIKHQDTVSSDELFFVNIDDTDIPVSKLFYRLIYEPSLNDTILPFMIEKKIIKYNTPHELYDDNYLMDIPADTTEKSMSSVIKI